MELTPCWRYTLGWLWQWLMRHATVSAQPNLRSQFKTSTQPLNLSPYGPARLYVLIPALFHPPSPFLLTLRHFFFSPLEWFCRAIQAIRLIFCACTALCNVLLIMSCCCWSGECGRGGFSCVLATSCAQDKKWSSGLHTLKTAPRKNLTPWPGSINGKNLGLVLQIHFLMKKNAKPLLVSETSIRFPNSRIKRRNVWERATFLALISAYSLCLCYILEA